MAGAGGECVKPVDAAIATLSVEPSAELAPYMPVDRLTTKVDGVVWAVSPYGTFTPPSSMNSTADLGARRVGEVFAACAGGPLSTGSSSRSTSRARRPIPPP